MKAPSPIAKILMDEANFVELLSCALWLAVCIQTRGSLQRVC